MMSNQYDVPLTVPSQPQPAAAEPAALPSQQEQPAFAGEPAKPKRVATESQLRNLAAGRKKQMEARQAAKKQAEAAAAAAAGQVDEEEEQDYEEEEEEEEQQPPQVVRVGKSKKNASKQALLDGQSASSRAMNDYYELKLKLLQSKVDADAAMDRYRQAPSERHMADVAKQELRKKLDNEAYNRAYQQLFGESFSFK